MKRFCLATILVAALNTPACVVDEYCYANKDCLGGQVCRAGACLQAPDGALSTDGFLPDGSPPTDGVNADGPPPSDGPGPDSGPSDALLDHASPADLSSPDLSEDAGSDA